MSIRHPESIRTVHDVSLRLTGEYHTLDVQVTTGGNIKKTLSISESEASHLCALLVDTLAERPADGRTERFHASIRSGGS